MARWKDIAVVSQITEMQPRACPSSRIGSARLEVRDKKGSLKRPAKLCRRHSASISCTASSAM
jgi:hypothetical protein